MPSKKLRIPQFNYKCRIILQKNTTIESKIQNKESCTLLLIRKNINTKQHIFTGTIFRTHE